MKNEITNLAEVLRLHQVWLDTSTDGQFANLTDADMTRANLTGANLTGADLTDARMPEGWESAPEEVN